MTDIPICFNRMGEEVMLALASESAEEECAHRRLAQALMAEILQDIDAEPERVYDWSRLGA